MSPYWPAYQTHFIDRWTEEGYSFAKVVFTRTNGNDAGVSEGMGYGLLMAVQNEDKATFDQLLSFILHAGFLDGNGLLNWKYDNTGVVGTGSATDADQDIAYALLLAGQKWGSSYLTQAKQMISAILKNDVDTSNPEAPRLKPGDSWGPGGINYFNPSYVAPIEWAAFAKADPEHAAIWNALIATSLASLFEKADPKTGLVGNWPIDAPPGYSNPNTYGYDACRVPMRLARYYQYLDDIVDRTEEQQNQMDGIRAILNKQCAAFYQNQISGGGLYSGYNLDGTPSVNYGNEACFNAPVMEALSVLITRGGIDGSGLSLDQAKSFQFTLAGLTAQETYDSVQNGPDTSSSNYYNSSLGLLNEGWDL